jgi:hypothetical protein
MRRISIAVLALFVAAITPTIANTTVRIAKSTDQLILKTGDDSIMVIFESLRVPFRPADFKTGDTVRFVFEDTTEGKGILKLYASHDSLELQPADTMLLVSMITATDTVLTRHIFMAQKPVSHFLRLLREYSRFAGAITPALDDFTYADSTQAGLIELRTDYHLDSIAGNGDEPSRIANLLHWVHTTVRHDGSVEVPAGYRVYDLLAGGLKEQRGVNCGVLAEVTNQVFLAMGFNSRRVVCLPYDTLDQDCHSINMVWSRHLGKWLYVDPTFEGMFQNSQGELLGIAEVREAMVSGDSLIVNKNLNWNGQPYSADVYFRYMAKNLFRFACSSRSGPSGGNRSEPFFWIHLDPTGYGEARSEGGATTDTSAAYITLYTDNATAFWRKP